MQNHPAMNLIRGAFLPFILFSTQAFAASCEDNFSVSGGFLSGKTYKTWADLPEGKFGTAYKGVYQYTVKSGWKILRSDSETGVISAVQATLAARGRTAPLDIAIEKLDAATRVSITFSTPVGSYSPEDAVKLDFCKTIAAADTSIDSTETTKEASATQESNAKSNKKETSAELESTKEASATQESNTKSNKKETSAKPESTQNTTAKTNQATKICLSGVCLGATLDQIPKNIVWNVAGLSGMSPHGFFYANRRESYAKQFRASPAAFDKIMKAGEVDLTLTRITPAAIEAFSEIDGSCAPYSLSGTFFSESGHETTVWVSPYLLDNGRRQLVKVSKMERRYKDLASDEDRKNLASQLEKQFGVPVVLHDPITNVSFSRSPIPQVKLMYSTLEISESPLSQFEAMHSTAKYANFPGCSKAQSID